jgi:hypothetical protein
MSRTRAVVVLLLLLATFRLAGLGAQRPAEQTGTGLILGRVVDAETNQPISGVLINLAGGADVPGPSPAGIPWRLLNDAQGRFVFRNLPRGSYRITATAGGNGFSPSGYFITGVGHPIGAYLNGGFGQLRPGGALETIDLGEGERIPEVVIRLWRGAAIEGTVRDEAGEPLVGMAVAAVRRSTDGRLINGPTTTTDDRGVYRISALMPGEYVVVVPQTSVVLPATTVETLAALPAGAPAPDNLITAMVSRGAAQAGVAIGPSRALTTASREGTTLPPVRDGATHHAYQTTFHPAAAAASRASRVVLRAGEERRSIDVQLYPMQAFSVSGTLSDGTGPVAQFGMNLMPTDAGDGAAVLEMARTVTDGRGAFIFPLVPAGQYTVLATRRVPLLGSRGSPPPEPRTIAERVGAWAAQPITVGGRDISDVALILRPPPRLSGRVEFQSISGRPAPNLQAFLLARVPPLFRDLLAAPPVTIASGGDFVVSAHPPGRYELRFPSVPVGWALQSVVIGGRDVTDSPILVEDKDMSGIVILLTDQSADLSGTVRATNGAPDPGASVFIFPADRTRWPDARTSVRSFRSTRVSKTGSFTLGALIPGDYLVAAVSDAFTADWPDEKWLSRLAGAATSVSISTGQKLTLSLKTADLR